MGKTPGYAPIEQMGNSVVKFTPATDIYALGATLYKLLTGTTPLEATLLASGEELVPLPSNISVSTANAISAAMQLAKSKRPQTIAEFLSLLKFEEKGATEEPYEKTERKSGGDKTFIHTTSSPAKEESHADLSDKTDDEATELNSTKNTTGFINGHEYVDLGLSVKWATCNVGASSPKEYGDYYAWGETVLKEYTFGKRIENMAGNPQYDVATKDWGGTWRLPTADEINELINKCDWKWVDKDGNSGYEVTGSNGNSIFLPAAGWCPGLSVINVMESGLYWSATPYNHYADHGYFLYFDKNSVQSDWGYCINGRTIRPVTE